MICNLCKINEANKENSHIIPKFLGKRLFESNRPRISLQINRKGKTRQIQDTPKEDFILCESCEKRLSILETYLSRKMISIHDYNNRPNDFEIIRTGPNLILECKRIPPLAFKLFFYSIFWRISISQLPIYDTFRLPKDIELEFGSFINSELKHTHNELIKSFDSPLVTTPKYHLIVFKPIVKNQFSRGVFTPFQASENLYVIFTPDIAIYLYAKSDLVDNELKIFSNFQDERTLVCLSSLEQWRKVNQHVIDKIIN